LNYQPNVTMEFETEVHQCVDLSAKTSDASSGVSSKNGPFPLQVELTNGRKIKCDFVVSATGVVPNTEFLSEEFELGPDRGVKIDETMATSVPDVFAAGDACYCEFEDHSSTWLQMRLWTQARVMGAYAARAMAGLGSELGFNFELFAHCTSFFGEKVVLLGNFNGEGLGEENKDFKVLVRCKPGVEFIRVLVKNHRMVGATLIGDVDLAETFENLLMNQINIASIEDELLREDVDLEDYFD